MAPTSEKPETPPVTAAVEAENPSASLGGERKGDRESSARQGSSGARPPAEAPEAPAGETQADQAAVASLEEARLDRLKAENEALYQRLLRLQAEIDNFRKRTEREKQDHFDYALTDFVRKLLPVLDAFERGLEVAEGETVADFKTGFQLVLKQFTDVLVQAGLEPIETSGQIFDPNRHQALMREETEAFADNQITGELQPGYTFKGRLLRPSLVRVATAPDETTTETQGN
ncbi:MAG: nucleotide exchange factor GrpE [Acidobacteriota bacterium]|nr:nucleotide exchange factor GrpE [Acidobacteriota bacterium]